MNILQRYACLIALAVPLAGAAADFPAKPIRVIVPWPPGGSTDTLARIVGQRLTTIVSQPIIIDNRPGVSGTLGADIASKANPDGYTITIVEVSHVLMPATTPRLPYDLARDFAPLTMIGVSPMIVFLNAAQPAKTLNEFIALAKAKPGAIAAAHTGVGSFSHLVTELAQTRTGMKLNQIGYKGAAPALIELAGGQVQLYIATLASAAGTLRTGRITAVAVAGDKRIDALPNVPTLTELGMKDMVINQWWGYVAPVNVQSALVSRLHKDLVAAIDYPSVRERATDLAVEVRTTSPAQLKTTIAAELKRWATVARDAGIKVE
jgi:tripartite-type tricarboxylate transporter receptor subunit TctC